MLIVFSPQVASRYTKMVHRWDVPSDTIKNFAFIILGIVIVWWVEAMIIHDWWAMIVLTLFIGLIAFVLSIMGRKSKTELRDIVRDALIEGLKDTIREAVRDGIVAGVAEVRRLDQEAKHKSEVA